MIILLHGENQILSRNKLNLYISKAKEKNAEVIVRDGGKLTLEEARNILESTSFFGDNRLSVWENFLSSTKSKDKEKILDYLNNNTVNIELILWEGKSLKNTSSVKFNSIEIFKIPAFLFQFLDSFSPDNKNECLAKFVELRKIEEAEMIFFMLIRQVRLLLMAENNFFDDIPIWQKSKMIAQSHKFQKGQLLRIYKNLLEIDYDQKTSGSIQSLPMRLEVLISSL